MAALSLLNVNSYVHGHDFTCDTNQCSIEASVNQLDATTFCDGGWQKLAAGVKSVSLNLAGFWAAGADSADKAGFTDLGVVNRVVTVAPTGTAGDVAYLFRAGHFNYSAFGPHGELAPFSLSASGTSGVGVVKGYLARAAGSVSSTGATGSTIQLPAVGAAETVYASLHLLGTAGTTITVVLESDDNSGFTSATARATFGPLTATGGNWASAAGAITDTYWRFRVSAITGTWTVAAAVGIA